MTSLPRVAAVIGALLVVPAVAAASTLGPVDAPKQVVVRFDRGTTAGDRAAAFDTVDATDHTALTGVPRVHAVTLPAGESIGQALGDLRANPDVTWAVPNGRAHIMRTPNDPLFGNLWGMPAIGAPTVWDTTVGSSAVTVGVVDSGISPDHPDLVPNARFDLARNFVSGGGVADPALWEDLNGHGTHVSGTIGAVGNNALGVAGVNWTSGIVAARAMDEAGQGTDSDIISAMGWAADHARVVNASLGGTGAGIAPLYAALVDAHPNTLFVFAAGNEGVNNDVTPSYPCNTPRPNVLCVAALDNANGLASFSNYGQTSVDLGAPGVDIQSTAVPLVVRDDQASPASMSAWTRSPSGSWIASTPPYEYVITDGNRTPSGGTLTTITMPAAPAYTGHACRLDYYLAADLPSTPSPYVLYVEARNPAVASNAWQQLGSGIAGSTSGEFLPQVADLGDFDNTTGTQVRFRVDGPAGTMGPAGSANPYAALAQAKVSCIAAMPGAGTYAIDSGTSMATPHVAGAAALLLSAYPNLTTAQLRSALVSTVTPTASLQGKTVTGGRLNVAAALASLAPAPAPPPAAPAAPAEATPASTTTASTMAAGSTATATKGNRGVPIAAACAGAAGTQCRFDLAIRQRVKVNRRWTWRTWGTLRNVSQAAGWGGNLLVPLNATARTALAGQRTVAVSLVQTTLPDGNSAASTTTTSIRVRRG